MRRFSTTVLIIALGFLLATSRLEAQQIDPAALGVRWWCLTDDTICAISAAATTEWRMQGITDYTCGGLTYTSISPDSPAYTITGGTQTLSWAMTWKNETSNPVSVQIWNYVCGAGGEYANSTFVQYVTVQPGDTYQTTATYTRFDESVGFHSTTIVPNTSVTYTFSNTSLTYNGRSQGPTITPSPAAATYSTSGTTATATNAGNYSVTATATGGYTGSATQSWTIAQASQTVSISPTSPSITAGSSQTFTATGGQTGTYDWSVSPSTGVILTSGGGASDSTASYSFASAGSYTVSVYDPGNTNYAQSNTATSAVTVNAPPQSQTITAPAGATITAGGSVSFSTSGGQTGSYNWSIANNGGGSAPAISSTTANSGSITFPKTGNYTVYVYANSGTVSGTSYSQSNTAQASVTVNPKTITIAATAAPAVGYQLWFKPSQKSTVTVPIQ
jgi:hypothetical protein